MNQNPYQTPLEAGPNRGAETTRPLKSSEAPVPPAIIAYAIIIALGAWLIVAVLLNSMFKDLVLLGLGAVVMLLLAAAPMTNGLGTRAKLLLRLPFLVVALALLLLLAARAPVMFPLSTRLAGKTFHDASLTEVLQFISAQRRQWPYWRFMVYDARAANSRLTITVPDGCTLREALDSVSRSVGCTYDRGWSARACSHSPPTSACFKFYRSGTKHDYGSNYFLFVSRYGSESIDEFGRRTLNQYDAAGNLIETSSQDEDENGRLAWRVTRTVYDQHGRAVMTTDPFLMAPGGKVLTPPIMGTKTVYDKYGRIVETHRLQGVSVTFVNGKATVASEGTTLSVSKTVYDERD